MSTSVTTESSRSVQLNKATKATKVGVSFQKADDGSVRIIKIRENSLASQTDLKVGDAVVSINGEAVDTSQDAAKTLRAAKGPIELVVQEELGEETEAESLTVQEEDSKAAEVSAEDLDVHKKESNKIMCCFGFGEI